MRPQIVNSEGCKWINKYETLPKENKPKSRGAVRREKMVKSPKMAEATSTLVGRGKRE